MVTSPVLTSRSLFRRRRRQCRCGGNGITERLESWSRRRKPPLPPNLRHVRESFELDFFGNRVTPVRMSAIKLQPATIPHIARQCQLREMVVRDFYLHITLHMIETPYTIVMDNVRRRRGDNTACRRRLSCAAIRYTCSEDAHLIYRRLGGARQGSLDCGAGEN